MPMRLIRLDSRRRHLRDDRGEDRVAPPRDRGHVHVGVVFLQVDVAVRFAERRFGLEIFGVDEALDHDLGFRRHQQIDGLRLHHVDRRADERAGDVAARRAFSGIFCTEAKVTHGGAPSTTAAGSFLKPRSRSFSQCL